MDETMQMDMEQPLTSKPLDENQLLENLKAEHARELRQVRLDGEVRYVLAKLGAKNPAVAAKVLDLSGVSEDAENGITGVEEAARRLMAAEPYLFGMPVGPVGRDGSSGGVHGESRRDPNGMSDREYYAMVMGNKR